VVELVEIIGTGSRLEAETESESESESEMEEIKEAAT
jgi:hypothetical protein